MSTLRNSRLFATLGNFVDVFSSAAAVASAVEAGRQPNAKALRTLLKVTAARDGEPVQLEIV